MSKKYIAQENNQSFLYPNNFLAEYDIDIIHDINNNSVQGIVENFTTTLSEDKMILTISFDFEWIRNNAEVFRLADDSVSILSFHIVENDTYYKPNQTTFHISYTGATPNTYADNVTAAENFEYYDNQFLPWPEQTFYYEIRFIGHRAIYPVMGKFTVTYPILTPTPTPTQGLTPTPTPTPSVTPTADNKYYYTGLVCGGESSEDFYSDTNLGDSPGIVRAYTAIGGGSIQCFDNVSRISRVSTNPILSTYIDCATCNGISYNYYSVTRYSCFPCVVGSVVIGRTLSTTVLTTFNFYNPGDGNVYLVNGWAAGPAYDIDLELSATDGTNCNGTCAL